METYLEEKIAEAQVDLDSIIAEKREALRSIPEDDEAVYRYTIASIMKRHQENIKKEYEEALNEIREEMK